MPVDSYTIVNDRILEAIDAGIVPWKRPWTARGGSQHQNPSSRHTYRGINVLLLSVHQLLHEVYSPFWMTWNQIQEAGGQVRKGAKSARITFTKSCPARSTEDDDETERHYRFLKTYRVFNLDQVDGIDVPQPDEPESSPEPPPLVEAAEALLAAFEDGPELQFRDQPRAFYVPARDTVTLPFLESFDSTHGYYQTLFHELGHSTGHPRRLNRPNFRDGVVVRPGGKKYAREELVAEISASYLCAHVGVEPDYQNVAAYLESWRRRISDDPGLLVHAASQAARAADWILGQRESAERAA